jgi:hypothetical protein
MNRAGPTLTFFGARLSAGHSGRYIVEAGESEAILIAQCDRR